jgi:DNA polymerase III subunit beta
MKLTVERAALLKALSHVQSVVERRTTIPILSNVLLTADPSPAGCQEAQRPVTSHEPSGTQGDRGSGSPAGGLLLAATDMDLEIVERVAAAVERPGRTTAPAHTLYDIVRKLAEGAQIEIELSADPHPSGRPDPGENRGASESGVVLRSGRSTFTLAALPPEDYPLMAAGDLPHHFALSAAELRSLIDRTRFAISTEETRYYLNGIYLHATKVGDVEVIRAVATDGHRLARVEMVLPEGAAGMPGVIIPRKTVLELRRLIEESGDEVRISLSETKIRFLVPAEGSSSGLRQGEASLTSKLIDGTFPEYDRVIPTGNDKILEVDCRSFAEAVDRVSTISTERSRAIKLTIERESVTLSATSPEQGSAVEELQARYNAEPIEIGFNSRYLLDIMEQIEGEGAQLLMSDPASPTIVRDSADTSALYVLMPLRV